MAIDYLFQTLRIPFLTFREMGVMAINVLRAVLLVAMCMTGAAMADSSKKSDKSEKPAEKSVKKKHTEKLGMGVVAYEQKYGLTHFNAAGENNVLTRCLRNWGEHPFKTDKQKRYREMEVSVKVLGIGGNVADKAVTDYPQLILIKPTIKVLSKQTITLMNPNGWYCFKSNVTVLGKGIIEAHCKAKLAESSKGVAVMGKNDESGKGGVTVLGKSVIKRVGC